MGSGNKREGLILYLCVLALFAFPHAARAEFHGGASVKMERKTGENRSGKRVTEEFDTGMPASEYFELTKEEKIKAVEKLIAEYRASGVSVSKSAEDYVDMMDFLVASDPTLVDMPLGDMFKTLCELEGDYREE